MSTALSYLFSPHRFFFARISVGLCSSVAMYFSMYFYISSVTVFRTGLALASTQCAFERRTRSRLLRTKRHPLPLSKPAPSR